MISTRYVYLILIALTLTGCSSIARQNATLAAGAIGCPANMVKVSEISYAPGSTFRSFRASCNGVDYVCSSAGGQSQATCTKSIIQPKPMNMKDQPGMTLEECKKRQIYNSMLKCNG